MVVVRVGLLLLLGRETLVGAGGGDEDDVLGHGSGSLVVLGVGHLPGLVGDEESRVEGPAKDGVDGLAVRESSVATLCVCLVVQMKVFVSAVDLQSIGCLVVRASSLSLIISVRKDSSGVLFSVLSFVCAIYLCYCDEFLSWIV